MVLPLFALGLLTAGTGIAKGMYDETQEQKRKQKMLDALLGPAETMADPVGASQRHVAQSGNPFGISRQAQATLGADPRAVSQQVRRANVDAVRAIGTVDPMAAFTMAQSMVPKEEGPLILSEGQTAFNRRTGRPEFSNPKAVDNKPSDQLSKLIAARDMLPEGHPNRALYDAAISKETERVGGSEETWSNPVAEIGPDGKPIQVRYGNKGGRQEVKDATPAKQGNAFDRQDYWRSYSKPYLDSAQNASAQLRKVTTSLALQTGVGDIAAINALQKQIDEGAVVRDQDVALITGAQSLIGRFIGADGAIKKGTVLTPELRTQIQAASDALSKAIQDGAKSRIEPYIPTMKAEGVDFESIVPNALRGSYGWTATQSNSADKDRDDLRKKYGLE